VASIARLVPRGYKYCISEGGTVPHPLTQPRIPSRPLNALPTFLPSNMFFDNNDFADLNSGYSIPENNNFDLNGYPLEPTYGEPSIDPAWVGGFDLNATVTSPTTAEITNWWLAPRPEGDVNGYLGSTLLGSSVGECAGVSGYQTEPTSTSGAGSCNAGEPYSMS